MSILFIYIFWVLRHFQHCTGHIMTGSWKGGGHLYIHFVRVLYCKLPTNDKKLPAFPLEAVPGTEPRPQMWEARVLPLCHRGPQMLSILNRAPSVTCLGGSTFMFDKKYIKIIFVPNRQLQLSPTRRYHFHDCLAICLSASSSVCRITQMLSRKVKKMGLGPT